MARFFSLFLLLTLSFAGAGFQVYQGTPAPFGRTASGIEYRIYRLQNGRYTLRTDISPAGDTAYARRVGQVLSANMQYRTGRDSVLFSSRTQLRMPLLMPLPEVKVKGGLEEALALLQPGDSATFRFQADSVFRKSFRQPVPKPVRYCMCCSSRPTSF
jgi:FKBP-type peptidyl-prolyl cis-trans isomerase FkpA